MKRIITTAKLLLTLLAMSATSLAMANLAGTVVDVVGVANAADASGKSRALSIGSEVHAGDTITTAQGSQIQLQMKDDMLITLAESSELTVKAYTFKGAGDAKDQALLKLTTGTLAQKSGQMEKAAYTLETPVGAVGIRGTTFLVKMNLTADPVIVVTAGSVLVTTNTGERISVPAGKKLVFNIDGTTTLMDADDDDDLFLLNTLEFTASRTTYRDKYSGSTITVSP